MPKIKILVTPYVVKNKPETERNHVVTGVADGWEKTSLNADPNEILTESKGLDTLLTDCNLKPDGVTKIDPSKPIGKEVEIEIYDPDAIPVQTVTVSPDTATGTVGQQLTFTADILPTDATYKDVEWSSSDEAKAKSLGNGVFDLKAVGTGIIVSATSIDGGVIGEAELTITAAVVAVTGVTLSPKTKTIAVGEKFTLAATVAPANATNKTVTYTSGTPATATVNATTGEVEGKASGTAAITGKTADGNKTDVCTVTVS
ncbi:tail fiber protein [Serratia phage 2050H1]|uniref:Tail fiber protein n=1 Tax=Serratia phage 2050H1 TaxID=2024250 RepID=A0A249Y2S9_9CAUD|nr:tail fiber protein [Serratia phage 2050H1]